MKIVYMYEINLKLRKQWNLWNYYIVKILLWLDFMHQINMKILTIYF